MPKLYTKKGDCGITSLYDGTKLSKSSLIFNVLGNIDELSSNIGVLCSYINKSNLKLSEIVIYNKNLRHIQMKLIDISSNLAVLNNKNIVYKITHNDVKHIESLIDECESKSKKLTEFLLCGYDLEDSQCHICRCICRRVEREMWSSHENGMVIDENILKYINRLSDFFFALSRNLSDDNEIRISDVREQNLTTI